MLRLFYMVMGCSRALSWLGVAEKRGKHGDLSSPSYLNPIFKKENKSVDPQICVSLYSLIDLNIWLFQSSCFAAVQTTSGSSFYQILPRLPWPTRSSSSFPSSSSCHCVIVSPNSAFHPLSPKHAFQRKASCLFKVGLSGEVTRRPATTVAQ